MYKSLITSEVESSDIYSTSGVQDVVGIVDVAVMHGIAYNIGRICVCLSDYYLLMSY